MLHCILDNSKICDDCGECLFCDLDPDKICDNCCKCIKSKDPDKIEISLNDLYAAMEQQSEEPVEGIVEDIDLEDNDPFVEALDGSSLKALDIDPELLKEWEIRLQALEGPGQPPAPGKNLHGIRKRRK